MDFRYLCISYIIWLCLEHIYYVEVQSQVYY